MAGSHGRMYVPRSRGALSGFLIVLLGVWGGLMPYLGASFDYTYTPDTTWTWTEGRFWLELLPAIAAVVGGLVLIASESRFVAMLGGWLAVAAGGWFVVGSLLSPLWDSNFIGQPVGSDVDRAVQQIGLFFGLGAVIILLSAFALGRLAVVGVQDVELGERRASERRELDRQETGSPTDDSTDYEPATGHSSFFHGRHRHEKVTVPADERPGPREEHL